MAGGGNLDRRIAIERLVSPAPTNEFNEPVETWAVFIKIWAGRNDRSDIAKTEILGAEQVGSFILSHFVVRSSARAKTISASDRINDGHVWNIKGTKETVDGRNRFIEITAVRENNG